MLSVKKKEEKSTKVNPQELQPKDQEKLTELIRLYEHRRCRKGIKLADQMLKKYPNHGEVQSLKAIHLYQLGRHDECMELLKIGLRANMSSHMSWHINALVSKGDHRWNDALRFLTMALRFGTSRNVLKDLVTTHAMIGGSASAVMGSNYTSFADATLQRLKSDPKTTANWMAAIVGLHAAGDSTSALTVLDCFMDATGESILGTEAGREITVEGMSRYERSETLLLRHALLDSSLAAAPDRVQKLLDHLEAIDAEVTDRSSIGLTKGALLLEGGRIADARALYRSLLDANQESKAAWTGLRACVLAETRAAGAGADAAAVATAALRDDDAFAVPTGSKEAVELLAVLDEYAANATHPGAPRTLALSLAEGSDFRARVAEHAKTFIARGIPSLMSTLKVLYPGRGSDRLTSVLLSRKSDAVNRTAGGAATDAAALANAARLAEINALPSAACDPRSAIVGEVLEALVKEYTGAAEKKPRDEAFARIFLATHLSWTGAHGSATAEAQRAVAAIDTGDADAAKLEPFLIDVLLFQAKVLKRAGDFVAAADAAERARLLDPQDRFINTLAAKHHLRALRMGHAQVVARAFTKDGITGNNLTDMHAMWLESHLGRAYRRLAVPGLMPALAAQAAADEPRLDALHKARKAEAEAGAAAATADADAAEPSASAASAASATAAASGATETMGAVTHALGRALAKHMVTLRHIDTLVADTTDFHDYCLGKRGTRAWLDQQHALPRHPAYRYMFDAAVGAVGCLTALADRSARPNFHLGLDDDALDEMPASDRRKTISKAKKSMRKAEEEATNAAAQANTAPSETQSATWLGDSKYESKLDPADLERRGGHLEAARPFLETLWRVSRDRVETHVAWAEVHFRTGKVMLVLRALIHGARVAVADNGRTPGGIDHPMLFPLLTRLLLALRDATSPIGERAEALKAHIFPLLSQLLGAKAELTAFPDPAPIVAAYVARNQAGPLECRVSAAISAWAVNGADETVAAWLGVVTENDTPVGHERLTDALTAIYASASPTRGRKFGAPAAAAFVEVFRKRCAEVYPASLVFASSSA